MTSAIIFLLGSLGIAARSWTSLRNRTSHGFYRFFAFEMILALILVNAGPWFVDPFAPLQLASWLFLTASLALAVHSFVVLRRAGKPEGSFENTTLLVSRGAYRYIRHPMYTSLLLFAWGAWGKDPSLPATALAIGTMIFLIAAALAEEIENIQRFGEEYIRYRTATKMFIPFLI